MCVFQASGRPMFCRGSPGLRWGVWGDERCCPQPRQTRATKHLMGFRPDIKEGIQALVSLSFIVLLAHSFEIRLFLSASPSILFFPLFSVEFWQTNSRLDRVDHNGKMPHAGDVTFTVFFMATRATVSVWKQKVGKNTKWYFTSCCTYPLSPLTVYYLCDMYMRCNDRTWRFFGIRTNATFVRLHFPQELWVMGHALTKPLSFCFPHFSQFSMLQMRKQWTQREQ